MLEKQTAAACFVTLLFGHRPWKGGGVKKGQKCKNKVKNKGQIFTVSFGNLHFKVFALPQMSCRGENETPVKPGPELQANTHHMAQTTQLQPLQGVGNVTVVPIQSLFLLCFPTTGGTTQNLILTGKGGLWKSPKRIPSRRTSAQRAPNLCEESQSLIVVDLQSAYLPNHRFNRFGEHGCASWDATRQLGWGWEGLGPGLRDMLPQGT